MKINGRQAYYAYVGCLATVFIGLGAMGFARGEDAPATSGGGVTQMGTVIVGHEPHTDFNESVKLDHSQVTHVR